MKKFILVLAVAGFAVACNNESETKTTIQDTAVVSPVPTIDTVTNPADTTITGTDTTTNR